MHSFKFLKKFDMKRHIKYITGMAVIASILATGCKKDDNNNTTNTYNSANKWCKGQ